MVKKSLNAETINLEEVIEFINSQLEENDCPMKAQVQIDIAAEEIFVNVAHYAYKPDIGIVDICVDFAENPRKALISFIDSGKPYNPLEKPDPDVTLSVDERKEGGLGIYMVKKSMDDVIYEFKNGQNNLTIVKNL